MILLWMMRFAALAEPMLVAVHDGRLKALGPTHPLTLRSASDLAMLRLHGRVGAVGGADGAGGSSCSGGGAAAADRGGGGGGSRPDDAPSTPLSNIDYAHVYSMRSQLSPAPAPPR